MKPATPVKQEVPEAPEVRVAREGALAIVTLSNPARLNAMTRGMWLQLRAAFEALNADAQLRCVLLRGEGGAFCAGGDISEYPAFRYDEQQLARFHEHEVWGALQALLDCPVPVVAQIEGAWPNMVALGVLAGLMGLPAASLEAAAKKAMKKGLEPGIAAAQRGYALAEQLPAFRLAPPPAKSSRWLISGNEAAGYGALRGGVRFVAAYPITPATELLEYLAPTLAKVGGTLVQAEDELASINMALGASYGGVPSLTATSGPGLALMIESLGLGVAAEVPVVVVDVMRTGPSTGIATKTEQADLGTALYGLHGDAPHVVVAPNSLADCLAATEWAVQLSESLQVPAIVLSDQYLGQARAVVDTPPPANGTAARLTAEGAAGYKRYALTLSGVSPMAIPGTPGATYTADGLEHNERGTPSSQAADHQAVVTQHPHDVSAQPAAAEGRPQRDSEVSGSVVQVDAP